jgi:hypothetical protein
MNWLKTPVKVTVKTWLLTAAEFQRLSEIPPEAEWLRPLRDDRGGDRKNAITPDGAHALRATAATYTLDHDVDIAKVQE